MMFCKWCGIKVVSDAALFCTHCGGKLKSIPIAAVLAVQIPKQIQTDPEYQEEDSEDQEDSEDSEPTLSSHMKSFLKSEGINAQSIITGVLGNSPMMRMLTKGALNLFKQS